MNLESILHHVALPPRLPDKQEPAIDEIELKLVERLTVSAKKLRDTLDEENRSIWDGIRRILLTCKALNAGRKLNRTSLLTEFRALDHQNLLILHLAEQNAGMLIKRRNSGQEDTVVFEAFEASAISESVLACEGALEWDFPGIAVSIPFSVFNDTSFQTHLASFLEQASVESIKRFAARAQKAGTAPSEIRNSVDPSLITQLLMTLLEGNGTRVYPPLLRKRVRDDVCWKDGGVKPWRRSPLWLIVRVGIQRHLYQLLGSETGRVHYKFFICLLLAILMKDMVKNTGPEALVFLQAKLNRRLAKLEVDKDRAQRAFVKVYESFFNALTSKFLATNSLATQWVERAWADFRRSIQRPVQRLPFRASSQDTLLSLPNSGYYLTRALEVPLGAQAGLAPTSYMQLPVGYAYSSTISRPSRAIAYQYFSLSDQEQSIELSNGGTPGTSPKQACIRVADQIDDYLKSVAGAYDDNPEQNSIMLLTVMELWVTMDGYAVEAFELLKEYRPGIPADILDVLQLLRSHDMVRLQKVQSYLQERETMCKGSQMSIFVDPEKGCFAERYFDLSTDSVSLQMLYEKVETDAQQAKMRKEKKWRQLTLKHESLNRTIATSACIYTTDSEGSTVHDDKACTKCYLRRKVRRMKIEIHEHPLPSDKVKAKAVVFELQLPPAFAAYRDATWKIISTLGYAQQVPASEPRTLLRNYSGLKHYHVSFLTAHLTLASTTKSFLTSHYSHISLPTKLDEVCRPNGLKFGYYDERTQSWPARQAQKPSFRHHCPLVIPVNSHFKCLRGLPEFNADAKGPSSYEIIASQTKCPPGLTTHEFLAYQTLFSGKFRRWTSMLLELGSSNLNFSAEATATLVSQLALQAGPAHESDHLRLVHIAFRDIPFCKRLLEQLRQRLAAISTNWREIHCMDMLITLLLRVCSIACYNSVVEEATQVLRNARTATSSWVFILRQEILKAQDANNAQRLSRYAFWAAILCKRTFALCTETGMVLEALELQRFIESSVTLQDNLVEDPSTLSSTSRNALVRDLKMSHRMRFVLQVSITANPEGLRAALGTLWPEPGGESTRRFSDIRFLSSPEEWWVQLKLEATRDTRAQTVHYHILEGHFLVDGRPLGKLPSECRKSVMLEQLFGNQSLLVYPSNLPGMSYQLAIVPSGHQIHIGSRGGDPIIRARTCDSILEMIPPSIFGSVSDCDLPVALVENCVHWLNLRTGVLEIRSAPNFWRQMQSHWILDVRIRRAQRRQVRLVDPHSRLFQRVASIFDRFEYRQQLTVFQPRARNLTVELPRLDLQFTVNEARLLESPQLQSLIDPDQDAGCWYGLNSKIVLRSIKNPSQRSIIVPLPIAPLIHRRSGVHVETEVQNGGVYGKFGINTILGRLDCPVEPRLSFTKALFHACTSFALPDGLTGRTGTEEALQYLESGLCQPWAPLNASVREFSFSISGLTARREYYPSDLKVMQCVSWDDRLTATIQSDEFTPVIEKICYRSDRLSEFASEKGEIVPFKPGGSSHLSNRSRLRRRLYARQTTNSDESAIKDMPYQSRDSGQLSRERQNIYECIRLLRQWSPKLPSTSDLAGVLQSWPNIQGYDHSFDKVLLSDWLDVDMTAEWGPLVVLCRNLRFEDRFQLMFLLGTMAFNSQVNMGVIQTLIAFAVLAELKDVTLPQWPSYSQFRSNQNPQISYLLQIIKSDFIAYQGNERGMGINLSFKQRRKLETAENQYNERLQKDGDIFTKFLLKQWPCLEPSLEGFDTSVLIRTEEALENLRPEWQRLFKNLELSSTIQRIQEILDRHHTEKKGAKLQIESLHHELYSTRYRGKVAPSLTDELIMKPALSQRGKYQLRTSVSSRQDQPHRNGASVQFAPRYTSHHLAHTSSAQPLEISKSSDFQELENIIGPFVKSSTIARQQYGRDLLESLYALKAIKSSMQPSTAQPVDLAYLRKELESAELHQMACFEQISRDLQRDDPRAQWLCAGRLWPEVTPIALLATLRSRSMLVFGQHMRQSLVAYAMSITQCQRLQRMEDALLRLNMPKVLEEQQNKGHENWSPLDFPDWILLEIEADILIRRDQVDVANATVSPASGSNSVLQMNMGQGKTSTIIPMAAALLANSKSLARIIVPKPLLLQTAQLLQARLGGLVGRDISHVPFSRKTSTKKETIQSFHDIHREALRLRGIILALPEQVMSFMLSGLQRLSDVRIAEATPMLNIQSWLGRVCRDVLDESDFTLAVRTQLIYPSGSLNTVDGHPHRWETAQKLLEQVEVHLFNLQNDFPRSVEVVERPQGGFPFVYFLRKDAEDALISRLINDICLGRSLVLPTQHCSTHDRLAIKQYISDVKVKKDVQNRVSRLFPDNPALRKVVHLLRGLFVHRILLLTLKKRWNVQYGLHPDRDPIAVPFHAKGVPSSQAEWGHPDVAILFTCLAFLYGGLHVAQLRQSLEQVLKSDDPSSEYDRWVQSSGSLPGALRDWSAINVDDETQLAEMQRHLQYNSIVINYFLNHFVFPVHAKQFRMKLQASGWDIPLFSVHECSTDAPKSLTTGFSGTNDIRTMLPLNIRQADLPRLMHTNADVLSYLIQPRNRQYVLAADAYGRHLPEMDLLRLIARMGIRVLIDAGAQILEMDNFDLAKAWLEVDIKVPAAVYFDSENRPFILHRRGRKRMPLSASPYADKLGDCFIYLDEAHTRGTDLKMPANACGALTLGLGQTKDHTVQAAMRLRQLGTTQSVVFLAPPEVHQSILDLRRNNLRDHIDSRDVICWLLEQTCAGIEQLQPLYYAQGTDFCRRMQAAVSHPQILKNANQRIAYLDILRQTERQSVEQLYGPKTQVKPTKTMSVFSPELANFMKDLDARKRGFQNTGNAVHGSALQEVEQEREVAFEVESVREVQKAVHFTPFTFPGLHKDIIAFVETGRLHPDSSGYELAFVAIRRTTLGPKYSISAQSTSTRLYVTLEFMKTVNLPSDRPLDQFQRHVNYVLWSDRSCCALIVNPEEAELLIPMLRSIVDTQTYILTYAAPVTRRMNHFNRLQYYSIPTLPADWEPPNWLVLELGLFAGRLYFEYHEYHGLRQLLGLRENEVTPIDHAVASINLDGPLVDGGTTDSTADGERIEKATQPKTFTAKPLTFLQEWLAIRRRSQDFAHTPMGHLCQGKPLMATHPFFARPGKESAPQPLPVFQAKTDDEEEYDSPDSGNEWVDEDDGGDFDRGVEEGLEEGTEESGLGD